MATNIPISLIRKSIREVLNMRPGFGKTEDQLLDFVNELIGGGVTLQDLRDAVEWNLSKTYVRSRRDEEAEETLWFITAEGIAKEETK
jgi:hypothetical protein